MIKKIIPAFLCLASIALLAACSSGGPSGTSASAESKSSAPQRDMLFPSVEAADIDGNPVDETVFTGHRLTVINIWGTFCGPCIREMPYLAELSEEYADRDVVFIGIPIDVAGRNYSVSPEMVETAKRLLNQTGVKYLQILPSASLGCWYLNKVQYIPETLFLDREGRLIGETYVGSKEKADWAKIIDSLLEDTE